MNRSSSMHTFMRGDQKEQLQATQKAARLFKKEKKSRLSGIHEDDIEIVNMFRLLGLDYFLTPRSEAMASIPRRLEGRRVDSIPKKGLEFLKEHFDVEYSTDREVYATRLHHLNLKPGDDEPMSSIVQAIAERTGEEKKEVKKFYDALVEEIKSELKKEKRAKLPGLGIFSLRFKPARKAGEKPNPFKKGEMMKVKAHDAENKLVFRPSKDLKEYAAAKIKVSKPKSKSSSSDDKKKKSSSSSSSSDDKKKSSSSSSSSD